MKTIRIWGLRRSGQHGIMSWLKGCAEQNGKTNICNNITRIKKSDIINYQQLVEESDWVIYNIEDRLFGSDIEDLLKKINIPMIPVAEFLILRDPFNLFASRMRSIKTKPSITKEFGIASDFIISIYKQHINFYFENPGKVILYNKWFTSKCYRKEITNRVGIPFNDGELNRVSSWGNGSSFDLMHYDGCAQKMRVLERWKKFKENKDYLNIFDDELVSLSYKVFPEETKEFINECC